MKRIAVVGGGPAGIMAAGKAAEQGYDVTIFEKNNKLLKKLYITGKGRCNFTNIADISGFFSAIPHNGKFLYSAFNIFFNTDLIELIEKNGTPTKTERGGRVFPLSDKASDVMKALENYIKRKKVTVLLNASVTEIRKTDELFLITSDGKVFEFEAVVICTGGKSYPLTGSTGDGYAFAQAFGHSLNSPKPALAPLVCAEGWAARLQGLSLKKVTLTVKKSGRIVYKELGEMLFTHFGVSGPLILSASSYIADDPAGAALHIDLKPGLTLDELDARILRDFALDSRKIFANSLNRLLPASLIPVIIDLTGIDPQKNVDQLKKTERLRLCGLLKCLELTVTKSGSMDEAIITRGGVPVDEINPSTMESKLVKNLFFAGEIIDVDALTGGFNLQIAFSTGALAGSSIKI